MAKIRNKAYQFFCGMLWGHRFIAGKARVEHDPNNGTFTITDTCIRCGKEFSFSAKGSAFGLPGMEGVNNENH